MAVSALFDFQETDNDAPGDKLGLGALGIKTLATGRLIAEKGRRLDPRIRRQ
jgi:hypothetical protein